MLRSSLTPTRIWQDLRLKVFGSYKFTARYVFSKGWVVRAARAGSLAPLRSSFGIHACRINVNHNNNNNKNNDNNNDDNNNDINANNINTNSMIKCYYLAGSFLIIR